MNGMNIESLRGVVESMMQGKGTRHYHANNVVDMLSDYGKEVVYMSISEVDRPSIVSAEYIRSTIVEHLDSV